MVVCSAFVAGGLYVHATDIVNPVSRAAIH